MLTKIKADLNQLKDSILENIKTNINDQCSAESYFYNWSALDFSEKISLDQRSKILDELLELFSRERTFTICEYTSKEDDVEPALWEGFVVKMIYEKKTGCDKTELLDQFRSAWPILNILWLKHCHLTDKHKKPSQLEIWKELSKGHALEYPEFCQFVQSIIATSPNTSDLERAYS